MQPAQPPLGQARTGLPALFAHLLASCSRVGLGSDPQKRARGSNEASAVSGKETGGRVRKPGSGAGGEECCPQAQSTEETERRPEIASEKLQSNG